MGAQKLSGREVPCAGALVSCGERPGTHKGPPPPHTTPCHYILGDRPTTRKRRGGPTLGVVGQARCSGTGGGWGWMGPCGCQASRHAATCMGARKLSGREVPCAGALVSCGLAPTRAPHHPAPPRATTFWET